MAVKLQEFQNSQCHSEVVLGFPRAAVRQLWVVELPTMEIFSSGFTRHAEFPWDILQYLSGLDNSQHWYTSCSVLSPDRWHTGVCVSWKVQTTIASLLFVLVLNIEAPDAVKHECSDIAGSGWKVPSSKCEARVFPGEVTWVTFALTVQGLVCKNIFRVV